MADPRFFSRSAPLSIEAVVEITGATLMSEAKTYPQIKDVRPMITLSISMIQTLCNYKQIPEIK